MMMKKILFAFCWLCFMAGPAYSADLSVACAANFTGTMKELAALYEEETGRSVQCSFGSTGMLYGQITKGAPYDLFLAADEKRPAMLFEQGLAESPSTYAKGEVVLWSKNKNLGAIPTWDEVLCCMDVKRVGIANPKTAPYGKRAAEAMATAHIYTKTEPKLAFGKSVGAAFQYAYSGAADVSFAALSQALTSKGAKGVYWPIPLADPVNQSACVLKTGRTDTANDFLQWMTTASARTIIRKYGYE
ncbi:molybdate ABC transporter substrate-binding protein [Pseudodesulfovibrio sp. zrk46]|uniref:molybdate ABC transporter substrate-binding protein n=1 Tax=Pseudodesulfovibrio sp. zrk46 TaxID=2725288 RepID=UPI0014496DB4|nr:molybdate ABC transporter substrate-binding protein [Pseudodesulfovibrio sp. zrk46]QJB56779.1 molybdate ABC transporter substrate-binding protein [Pseudodesulfovibrio sp. zrk46]